LTIQRVRDALTDCGFRQAADLNADAPTKLARSLRERLALPRTRRPGVRSGISAQSASFILAAMRRFARWLAHRRLPVRPDLFDGIPGFDPAGNRVHARREVSHAELTRLLTTTAASRTKLHGLTGRDRAMLYLLAFSTGFRASELARLTREHVDVEHGIATIPGDPERKATRTVRQPIPDDALTQLRPWLAKRKGILFPGDWSTNPARLILQPDLAAAGVTYCLRTIDGPRYADFHSLRHSYLSALAASGVGIKELQELARHSDPRLTLGIYTHAREEELAGAVGKLRIPG
jgi:integrase